jgi:hypothetical protein
MGSKAPAGASGLEAQATISVNPEEEPTKDDRAKAHLPLPRDLVSVLR